MTDTDTVELKPCPFCGSDNVQAGGDDKVVGVWCHNCGAAGPNGYLTINGDFEWNTRTIAALPPAAPPTTPAPVAEVQAKAINDAKWYGAGFMRVLSGGTWDHIDHECISIHPPLDPNPPEADPVSEAAKVLLANMPNPVFDNLKPVLMGEFGVTVEGCDEDGEECHYIEPIDWTTIKDILSMAVRALTKDGEADKPIRCAECDCENGGAECNWITTPKETDRER